MELPEAIGKLGSLKQLHLIGCESLDILPATIGKLGSLTILDLHACMSLRILPDEIGGLTALTTLDLQECSNLILLPDTIGGLTALTTLIFEKCTSIVALPPAISALKALSGLNLAECTSLALSEDIGGLAALTRLDLSGSRLATLPDAIGELEALQTLELSECEELAALPDTIGGLVGLEVLNLFYCSSLRALPDSIGELKALKMLNAAFCPGLTALPDAIGGLTALSELHVVGCMSITTLPDAVLMMPGLSLFGWSRARNETNTDEEYEAIFKCPISTGILVEPMKARPCGHVYFTLKASAQSYFKGAGKKCAVFSCDKCLKWSDFVVDEASENAVRCYHNNKRLEADETDEEDTSDAPLGHSTGVAIPGCWNPRGFGFIKPDDGGEDLFCPVSSIIDGNALGEGAKVTYLKVFDGHPGKERASQVRGGYTEEVARNHFDAMEEAARPGS